MRCPSCSSAVADGRRFCTSCGTPVAANATERVAAGTQGAPATAPGTPPTAAIVLPDAGYARNGTYDKGGSRAQAPGQAKGTGYGHGTDFGQDAGLGQGAGLGQDAGLGPDGEYDEEEVVARDQRTTQMLTPVEPETRHASHNGRGMGDAGAAIGRAGDAVRRHAGRAADRFGAAPVEVRVAMIGAAVTVLSFLALPYADDTGTAANVGGRLWWRPIAAVVATILLATTLRIRAARATSGDTGTVAGTGAPAGDNAPGAGNDAAHRAGGTVDRLLAALVVAAVGATEAGLVGLFSGDTARTRIGYYGMLAGLVTVLVASARAARRRCGA